MSMTYQKLLTLMSQLEDKLGAVVIPTLGSRFRPNPPGYVFEKLKEVFDGFQPRIRMHADQVREYIFSQKLDCITDNKIDDVKPYWDNGYFPAGDARLAYAVIARYKPRLIMEIGCGNSTKFMRTAVTDFDTNSRIICIDPEPRANITDVADEIHRASLQDVDIKMFERLHPGDVLFMDGSHLVLNGSDCVQFFLELVPRLPRGIWVHLHDIFLPFDYPHKYFFDHKCNEQYLLAMLFLYSREWVPALPIYYAFQSGILPHGGGSFWMIKE